ncbi:MAG: alanine--tRNA ligase [Verrucomicrobiae bacterium]|nr:alanine--tRNA ligase [Verrucomicrobiae bacterium]
MTSKEIRQSFLDFFREKQHTIVPSSSLLPEAPNLLFTNAGMNQFVPIFLGQVPCPFSPARAADTQKCIRAGGKHNDLEDVGLDTYHHTFFEMLGNWSFGDYFKREAIDWAWELLVERWGFPKTRLFATYFGGDEQIPADLEARDCWLQHLPPERVVPGGRKDNFWMMGDTGPCGPCSEIHVDLTPDGSAGATLVNAGSPLCIEIWNLVFIQFNANADGSLSPLPAKHVDTGMGFERACAIIQCTDGLRDFRGRISNYETDVFRPIFGMLQQLCDRKYLATLPGDAPREQVAVDVAFRVIADHIRCLSFAIADGILPSNEGRGYVLRRILRRAVRYGRNLGFREPFFYKLADAVAENFGDVFPELQRHKERIRSVLRAEEESFNRTLDRGIELFEEVAATLRGNVFPAAEAFKLYDTYGFPLDLTELMARERGLTVDVTGFERLMEEQRQRAREDYERKKAAVTVVTEGLVLKPTRFIGYDHLEAEALVEAVMPSGDEYHLVLDQTPFYGERGGQVGDTGLVHVPGHDWTELGRLQVLDTQWQGELIVHRARLHSGRAPEVGEAVRVAVDAERRANIQRHHTAAHLFHWALREVVGKDTRQRGSLVAPDRFRFDFNHPEKLSEAQIADIERLVNERIRANEPVWWTEVPYSEVRNNPDIQQFFGEKYGEIVRVLQCGGHPGQLDGFSMELCGGCHVRNTGDIGLFKIAKEFAIAAGIRRVEAVCGRFALEFIEQQRAAAEAEAARQRALELEKQRAKQRQAELQARAPLIAEQLLARRKGQLLVENLGEADAAMLRAVVEALKPRFDSGVVVLGGISEGKVSLICYVTPDLVREGKHAGKIIAEVAKLCGGGGGGRPELATAGGKHPEKLAEALAAVTI